MSGTENITDVTNIVTTASNNFSTFSLITSSDIISKFVMLMLLISSVWAWAIIFYKIFDFRQLKKKIASFESFFWSGQMLEQLYESAKRGMDNPLSAIFIAAMDECRKVSGTKLSEDSSLRIAHKERISKAMDLVCSRTLDDLEKNLGFLATVSSSAPFIGLFGTVWGIIHSFQSIAVSKNTSLTVVAPGIAEALLATAIGLFAAIPALIFYNYLSTQITHINNRMDDFTGELTNILSRAIDEEKI